jgi:hypothetical protein
VTNGVDKINSFAGERIFPILPLDALKTEHPYSRTTTDHRTKLFIANFSMQHSNNPVWHISLL